MVFSAPGAPGLAWKVHMGQERRLFLGLRPFGRVDSAAPSAYISLHNVLIFQPCSRPYVLSQILHHSRVYVESGIIAHSTPYRHAEFDNVREFQAPNACISSGKGHRGLQPIDLNSSCISLSTKRRPHPRNIQQSRLFLQALLLA